MRKLRMDVSEDENEITYTCPLGHKFKTTYHSKGATDKPSVDYWKQLVKQAEDRGVVMTMKCPECK